jgi:hypothetical protein
MTTKDYLNIPCTWDMDEVSTTIDNTESLYKRMARIGIRLAVSFYKNAAVIENPRIAQNFVAMNVVRAAIEMQRENTDTRNDWVRLTTTQRRAVYIQWLYNYAKDMAESWHRYPDAYKRAIEDMGKK